MAVGADGLWIAIAPSAGAGEAGAGERRPALFLDRDGVIVDEVGYLARREDVRLIAGAAAIIAAANRARIPVVVVTNQSGIGRGIISWADFAAVEDEIARQLARHRARLDAVLACPHHAQGRPPYAMAGHPARKPAPGLLLAAAQRLPIDLRRSWIVGDRASDLAAGRNAGLAGGVHVATGFGTAGAERAAARQLAGDGFDVRGAPSIAAAATLLPLLGGHGG
ncbi:MAG: HAD-IIIA family hydrolase [Rhodospirillales bacterium]|nr:HAD-IIIA family hydrolase [Rhodospirillales bacterium]